MAADPLMFYPAAPNRPPSDPSADDPRKVKFLCSFGGQIIPRPSDGALRYAGGQTRIISVRRDAPLPEIMNKMAEVFGGHAALRYQLPDVDLDALVSVSSPEDLENMMEEYDKIAEAAPDGSAKLRVFLFSPSDLAADPASLLDLEDYSQRYVEAVNRISSDGSLRRKDSLASASSAHNSAGGINGGTSPEILSPTAAAGNDSSRLFFVGAPSPPAGFPDPPVLPANPSAAASNATTSRVELSPYTSQPYADPNQFQYMNSQPMGTPPGSLPISPLAIPQPQYQYAPVASHIGTEKSVPTIVDSYGGRTTQLHVDPNSRAGNQLVSQLLPVPPTYLQPQNVELYGVRQAVPPPMQGQGYRLEDCYMCHKALPHAHSDTQVQEHGNATSEASTTFHSLRAEDATRLGTPNRVIAPPMTENKVAAGAFVSYGFAPIPEVRHDNEKLVVPNVVSDHSSALRPPATMGLPSDTQASSGMFVNVPQYRREDSLQKQQQQSLVQPQPMVKQDGIVELYRNGVYPVKNENLQAIEALKLGHVPEFPSNYPGTLEGMMETLRVSPFDNLVYNEERKPTVSPNLVISKELKPEKVPLVEINHPVRPHVGGNSFMGSGFRNPGIKQEGSYARPVDQHTSSLGLTQSQNLQPTVSSQVSTQETFFFNHETGREPMVPSKVLHAMPAYSCSINPVQTNNNTNTVPDGDQKDEASRYSKDMLGDFAAPTSIKFPFPFPNSIRPTQQVELFDEPILPDSLFPSQDPIKISGGTNFLPPRPIRVASRESVIAKDLSTENLSIANQGPDIALLLDDNVFYQPSNSLIKDSCREPVARGTRGSEDEKINKELQAVAEGAATAVLQSSVPPIPVFVARETKGSTSQFNIGVIDDITSLNNATFLGDYRVEDTKSKPAENLNSGFLIGDEIGRLQIIKNSDLEELKELGSGTFGTVYHGKWRGSDVAIKRINNRCFAGKPSEQERTRADFWNEASKLSDLHHPNVVAFYGVVVDGPGGSVATVTEYMVNGSLRQALQKNDKTFDRSKRLLIAMDVAFGMEYLHSKNIVHFDLKSDNLLVNLRDPQRPICKVGDLGLSKVKCQTLISGGVRGTLPWMAPELLNGSSSLVSEKVDVFSFGIVMWEILTGKEPYADMHYGAIIGGIVSNTLRPPVPETCELDWRSLMERCWSSEPSERPSFTEIASGLRAMAASPSSKGR